MNGCNTALAAALIAVHGLFVSSHLLAAEAGANEPARLRVAVTPLAAALDWTGDQPTGVIVDIWEDLAGRLGKATDFVKAPTFQKLIETMPAGTADVALGPIAITEEQIGRAHV